MIKSSHFSKIFTALVPGLLVLTSLSPARGAESGPARLRLPWDELKTFLNIDRQQVHLSWEEFKYLLEASPAGKQPRYQMEGGEVFVPKIPSTTVVDLAKAIVPNAQINIIGIRPGEKLHEDLISDDEARHSVELESMYVIQPAEASWFGYSWKDKGKPLPEGFTYTSDNNTEWLDIEGIKNYVAPFEELFRQGKLEG
jgi:hypothetical protein